jgi:hypothetical protein
MLTSKLIRFGFGVMALEALLASCAVSRSEGAASVAQSRGYSCVFKDLFTDRTFEEFAATEAAAAVAAREDCEAKTGNPACLRVRCSDDSLSSRTVPESTLVCEATDSNAEGGRGQAEDPSQNRECRVVEKKGDGVKCRVEDARRDGEVWYATAATRVEAKKAAMDSCLGDAGIECVHRGCIDAVDDNYTL